MLPLIKYAFHDEPQMRKKIADFFLEDNFLSMGSYVEEYESEFAKKQERKYAVMVNSGSSANLVLLQALLNIGTLKRGDRVGFSALTWSTNVMPIIQLGLIPVPIDCESVTLNISPQLLQKEVKNIQALFLTHVLGFADDVNTLRTMCRENNVLLLEDTCESLGSKIDKTLLGNFGEAATFSFYIGHHISTIEGGMVVTDDKRLYDALLIARAHGWGRNLAKNDAQTLEEKNKISAFYARYTFYDLGFNVRPMELQGFIGINQIMFWDEIVSQREQNFQKINRIIKNNPNLKQYDLTHMSVISNFAIPLLWKDEILFEKALKRFTDAGVETRPIIAGDMTQQPFYKKYVKTERQCENASSIHKSGFYVGNNQHLSQDELDTLSQLISQT
ncbi:MAG: DegT/DnrJ/EryC1/StrS family aminotransferase [Candidatus Paceibacterota bacterium]